MQNVQIKNKVEILRYTLVFLAFAVSTSLYALTATEVMNKAASYAKAAKGLSVCLALQHQAVRLPVA